MGFFGGLVDIVTSPIRGVATVIKDVSGDNGDDDQMVSVLTCGLSSVVKGVAKGIVKGADKICDDE